MGCKKTCVKGYALCCLECPELEDCSLLCDDLDNYEFTADCPDYTAKEPNVEREYLKPLTPAFRTDINVAFNKEIRELKTCKPNGLVNAQITALELSQKIINLLPDGYLMPVKENTK